MPAWLEWTLLGTGGWLVSGTVFAFLFARTLAQGAPAETVRADVAPTESAQRVLLVDDDAPLRSLLRATLAGGAFDLREAGSAEQALDVMRFWKPDLVLLDVSLPGLDGLSFCTDLVRGGNDAAVILLTGEQVSETTARMAGAKAVVRKPFSPLDLLTLIERVVERREFVSRPATAEGGQLLMYARDLATIAQAERRQRQLLQDAYRQTATALADAVDVRDRATGAHAQRVRRYALGLAEAIDSSLLDDPSLEYGFLLHDVGKIGIADQILLKPGPLTDEEQVLVREHPVVGAQILRNVALLKGSGLGVVRHHHERWDGAGYPDGLSGEEIPLAARIFALADTLDAMTTDRPYRPALSWSEAVEEIVAQSGRQFDPHVVDVFLDDELALRAVYDDVSLVA